MSLTEIIVIAFGLFLGYWVVSNFTSFIAKNNDGRPEGDTRHESSSNSTADQELEWFVVLKVSQHATAEEIHTAYRSLIRQYHPDKVATLGEELRALAEQKSKSINAAYAAGLRARGL